MTVSKVSPRTAQDNFQKKEKILEIAAMVRQS